MYREIVGTDERVQAIPGVRDRRVRATKVRLYNAHIWCLKNVHIGLHALFLNEKVLTVHNVLLGVVIYNSL